MHRYEGQRKHIIQSLESVLYQLHALSFILSPSIWIYLARVTSQFQFARPRSIDPKGSLRFWFFLIFLFQFGAVWSHAQEGSTHSRPLVLDFVGMGTAPSKLHLLLLDFLIIFLEVLLTTTAWETSYLDAMPPSTPDALLPASPTHPASISSTSDQPFKHVEAREHEYEPPYVIDLRLSTIIDRLRNPPLPPTRETSTYDLIPLPNTTSLPISGGLRMLLRARQQLQERARSAERRRGRDNTSAERREEDTDSRQTVPGGFDTEDDA
ncbi:hypothetical protein POSPLADRAFT_1133296 [Postia placenta MAD-698-R-SB12]|uniref:DUF1746 domain-containing protein n=1 Tax=Postia placenta MAD-698-R-SB12 TaxID=670580 RepID=A0A1X6NCY0_9APHY|nr:hypothetical protein POSPLADRAFT_1133296 [Postia placenta MAD-698-R-SB12]OSX66352.1 hypothetical protein POSPLADRAFT_1133296 [Postia placenta MAD-698-R-SB12]